MKPDLPVIDTALVHRLIASQFPKWQGLPIETVTASGWDNRTFHLGKKMLVRLPSAAEYAPQVDKEHKWLPKLAAALPVSIPTPLEVGKPEYGYPWKWSIYRWLEGETVAAVSVEDLPALASDLASFLLALHQVDTTGGPLAGIHSFYRGGSLSTYDSETRRAINLLKGEIDECAAVSVWETALSSSWTNPPVWVHGDISAGNLLVQSGKLSAVIDFGQLSIGDPACDLVANWTLFQGRSRKIFQESLPLEKENWERARGWALWKSLLVAAELTPASNFESKRCWHILKEVIQDHNKVAL
jgi:aminoglycoside phosphotransferase (APT) family kinase protein